MPYEIQHRDGKFCVVKEANGRTLTCHETEQEAKDQIAAISISENAKAYKTEQTDEGMVVKDVIMALTGTFGGDDLTVADFERFERIFEDRVARGYIGAKVLLSHGGPPVGKIIALRHDDNFLYGDLLIQSEAIQESVKKSDLTDVSITYFVGERLLDVSLLDNTQGELSDFIPPLLVEAEVDRSKTNREVKTFKLKPILCNCNKKEQTMAFSKEDLEALGGIIKSAVDSAVEAKFESEEASREVDDIERELDETANKRVENSLKQLEKAKVEYEINSYVNALTHKTGNQYGEATLRKIFNEFKTEEGRKAKFEALMEKSDREAEISIEKHYSSPSVKDKLLKEFEAKGGEKALGVTGDWYVNHAIKSNLISDLK